MTMLRHFCAINLLAFSIGLLATSQSFAQTVQWDGRTPSQIHSTAVELPYDHVDNESASYQLSDRETVGPHFAGNQSTSYSLEDFESLALSSNPTLRQARAQITAAEGAAYQAGLLPNPVVGYTHETNNVGNAVDEHYKGMSHLLLKV